ncbi:hypothetical protein [Hymenobacter weizhouensis]|uniref:hypothetical protein n=1 Tax=Hymenobacter sp. YIM 151500-1 TaxID=2987689 RepID=UPI002225D02A|nr:hypothetical protein [Hymenobacter sp. YIM 151500-1]UYZ61765.1 hypothetical protein OIS53_12210 [Hymenobacter sp. YIM 151500-1]
MKLSTVKWVCAVLLGLSTPVWAQQPKTPPGKQPAGAAPAAPVLPKFTGKLSSEPEQFMVDAQSMMASTNNAGAKASAAKLQQVWASNRLTATNQRHIVALSQYMLARKFRPKPHFELFFTAITAAAGTEGFSDQQMTEFLDVVAKTLEKEPVADTEKFLFNSANFLQSRYLYRSRYSSLRVVGGTFSFAYNAADMPSMAPPAAPQPAPAPADAKSQSGKAPKKKSADGWDTADMWSGGDWGADDGWGGTAKKTAPAAKAGTPAKASPAPAFEPTPFYNSYVAPPTRGPVLLIKDADLFMASPADSVYIRKTSGAVVPAHSRFVGYGGEFAWQVKGNPASAQLTTYDFDISKAEFTAQPVTLTYAAVLETPIKGALSYKSVKKKPGATDSGYPRFISLTNDARVKNIGDNIRYYGGFSLAGGRTLSASLDGSLSRILVDVDGKPKFRAASGAYELGDSVITAQRAAVTIYQGKQDSLTHPGVRLKFSKPQQTLQLARESGLYKTTPYYDSYHQMEISTELLTWPLRTSSIDLTMLTAKNQVTANFESKEFYTNTRYQQIKAINKLHPLQMIVGYSLENGNTKLFTVQDVATFRKLRPDNVRSAVAGLARDGYVGWYPQTDQILLLPKALHYVNSSRGKKDYDHIAIKSLSPSGRNATLDLTTNDLIVRGVDRFNFSDDSVTVFVKPDSSVIRIQKNRGVLFNGTVVASAFVFKGKEFKFDYDGFYIDLVKIDSIIVKGKGSKGSVMKARKDVDWTLTNKKKNSAGRLYINHPNNKSGRKKLGAYPTFDATTGAYVFFNKPEILGGAYDTTIFFDIPPFKLDSLNNKNRAAVGFKGTFVSGGIMPNFNTKLSMQDDGSLGFVYNIPKEGFPLYGGKGRLHNKVAMSNRGIQGIGNVKYLTGDFNSEQFIFYRDSVVTVGKTATISPGPLNGTEFAKVTFLPGYQMKWAVKQDSMYLTTQPNGEAFRMYDLNNGFKGTLTYTPGGLYGDGRMDGAQSFIRSTAFEFKPTRYTGRKATLSIKSAEVNKPAVTANNVNFTFDLKGGNTEFAREEGDTKSSIDLPYSQYRTTLSGGKWDFKKKIVQFKVAPGADSSRSFFYSTKPEQNGLKFQAASGQYDLSRYRLVAGGVPRIAAADAWITPDSNKVYILPNAVMRDFQNASIVMDTLHKYHNLYKGEIKVLSRHAFSGNALYSYKNAAADSFAIKFANFRVDSSAVATASVGRNAGKNGNGKGLLKRGPDEPEPLPSPPTLATATLAATDKFHLAPRIAYRGGVQMNSQRKGFMFDGQARLEFVKAQSASEWFAVQDSIDPKSIRVKVEGAKSDDGTPMLSGLFLSEGTGKVYPLFVAPKPGVTDANLFEVDGSVRYDQKKRIYAISRHNPADPDVYEGSVLTLQDSTGAMNFRGKLNFINSNKDYALAASGLGYAKPDSGIYELDAFMNIDINLPEKAVEAMGQDLATNAKGLPEALNTSQGQLYKIGEFVGSKAVQDYSSRKGNASLQKLSAKFLHTLVLSQVNLRWDERLKAWYSVGKIGLVSVGKKDINALIDGYIEIKKESTGDNVEIYLEAEPQTWYYLKYQNNTMLAKAQHGSFDEIVGLKAKGDYNTATEYGFFLGDDQEVQTFLNHFRKDYLKETGKKKINTTQPVSSGSFDFMEEGNKKKKKKKDPVDEALQAEPGAAPPAEEPAKKKKKKDEATEAAPAPTPAATEPAPPEDTGKKKKKKEEAVDAAPPADAPAPPPADDKKKKKKKEADDPFGD